MAQSGTQQPRLRQSAHPVTRREYDRAVRIAEAVLRWAERQVEAAAKKREGKK